jgi:hypothetical protein
MKDGWKEAGREAEAEARDRESETRTPHKVVGNKNPTHKHVGKKDSKPKKHAIICHKSGAKGCLYFPNHASWAKFFTLDLSGATLQHRQIAPMFSNKCFYILK